MLIYCTSLDNETDVWSSPNIYLISEFLFVSFSLKPHVRLSILDNGEDYLSLSLYLSLSVSKITKKNFQTDVIRFSRPMTLPSVT